MLRKWLIAAIIGLPIGIAQADTISIETKCLEVKVDGLSIGSGDCGPQRHYHEPARHYDEYHYHDGPRGPEWKHRAKWKHNGKGKPPGHWEKREKVTYEEEWYYTEGHRH